MAAGKLKLEDWLDDLCVRFIINLPQDDLSSVPRICFQVEEAQWYYEDFIRPLDPSLPSMSLRTFCLRIFAHCPLLSAFSQENHISAFEDFLQYKIRVPVRGAILLNAALDSVLLVKGWKKNATWSFPRGKINMNEDDLDCAVREVYEETGYDLESAGLVPETRDVKHIEINIRDQNLRLYVFKGVPMETHFEPRTRKEISKIQWWRLSDLPAFRKKGQQANEPVVSGQRFYNVAPFLVQLRKWVMEQKKKHLKQVPSIVHLSAGMSQDELLTEEERIPKFQAGGAPSTDAMNDATTALKGLLKIQPPTEGLQPEANNIVCSPVFSANHDKGAALLALLRPKAEPEIGLGLPATTTPSAFQQATTGLWADQYARDHASFAPSPVISMHPSDHRAHSSIETVADSTTPRPHGYSTSSYATRHAHEAMAMPGLHHPYSPSLTDSAHGRQHAQQILHPQPLPPSHNVLSHNGHSRSYDGPQAMHPEVVIPGDSRTMASVISPTYSSVPHAGTRPKQGLAHLSDQKLALLGAFQSGPANPGVQSSTPRKREDGQPPATTHPLHHELSADSHESQAPAFPSPFSLPHSMAPAAPTTTSQRPHRIPTAHQSALLDMFKASPTAQQSFAKPSNPKIIFSSTSAAVELSTTGAIESDRAQSSNPPGPVLLQEMSERSPSRPPMPQEILQNSLHRPGSTTRAGIDPSEPRVSAQQIQPNALGTAMSTRQANGIDPAQQPPTLFQPQILKRPQTIAGKNVKPLAGQGLPSATSYPVRPPQQPTAHVANLLALFGTARTSPVVPPTDHAPASSLGTPKLELQPHSRLGSLASTSNEASSRRGSPISPADKGFLLSYLDAVAKTSLQ